MRRALPAVVALLVGWAGCRTALGPVVPLSVDDARPAAFLTALERDAASRRTLRALAQLALDGPAGSGRAKHVLVVEQPARLRFETLGFLNQTLALLVTDAGHYRLFDARERTLHEGLVYPTLLLEVAGVALTPEEVVGVLLGAPAPPAELRTARAWALPEGGVRVRLERDAESRQLDFDPQGRLRRLDVSGPVGLLWEARFDDYRPLDATDFAHEIELEFPATSTRARISFKRVELNPELPPDVFVLELPSGATAPGGLG